MNYFVGCQVNIIRGKLNHTMNSWDWAGFVHVPWAVAFELVNVIINYSLYPLISFFPPSICVWVVLSWKTT